MMGIIITPRPECRFGTASAEDVYNVIGTADRAEALAAVLAQTPVTFAGLVRQDVSLDEAVVDPNHPEASAWIAHVPYGLRARAQTGDAGFSFEMGGGTQHITQSLETMGKYAAPGETALDYGGAIGVTDSSVEGVDIVVPVYNWMEPHYFGASYVTGRYKANLFHLVGSVNDATFRDFERGEVILVGAAGAPRGQTDYEISFKFAASPNKWDRVVGDITGIRKRGWEYLWVRYRDEQVGDALVKKPYAVYVERVYEYGDFRKLGIGV